MNKKHLSGAFSPFTIALQNIRDNLFSKKNSEDIRYAYLQEIITLSIPIHTKTKGDVSIALEFPVAACWKNKSEDPAIFRYSGQYITKDREDFKESKEKIEKAQLITTKIENKINEYKMRHFKGPEIVYENAKRPFADSVTDYPESLRKIKGCWKLDCDDLRFLVFFTYVHVPDSIENPIGQDDREQIRESFESCFLSEDSYKYLSQIMGIKPNEHHEYGEKDKKGYPVLRDILSNIQRTIDIIAKSDKSDKGKDENSTEVEELSKIFGVVFVLPTIMDEDDEVGFRYILTHQQIRFFEEPGAAERIDSLIMGKEKEVLPKLWESHKKCLPNTRIKADCFGEDSSKQLKALINNLQDNLIYDGLGKIEKNRSAEVEELLRKTIYAYYAFASKTKTEFSHEMSGEGIAKYIESDGGTVRSKQTVLIRNIFSSRSPDVVENFINHPLSKIWKPTERLIDQMEDDSLYPRALLLLETIFFPKRFFMYPLYQHKTPVLLCAFNADSYLESRQSLKSILDRHIQGIFSAILNHELVQANELFASMTSWSDTEAIGQIKRKLRQLLLHFCPEIEKIENIELREIRAADVGSVVGENKGWEFKVSSTTRISLRDDKEQLLTVSPDGLRVLDHYTKLYEETVARFREIADLSSTKAKSEEAKSQTLRWAHAIKTELGEISMISELIAPTGKPPISHEPNISSYIESLRTQVAILSNSVGSLKNRVNALQLSTSIDIEDYIKAEASKEDFRWVMFDALRIAFLNLLLSTKRECSNKKERWFTINVISSYDKLRNISLLKYQGDSSVSELISSIFDRGNYNQAEFPLKIADSSFEFSIPSSGDKYYPNILVIILSEVIFNALKYTEKGVEIGIEENNSYNFISVKNPFSCEKSRTDIGLSLVKTMSERVLIESELSQFTYDDNGEKIWIFKMPVYKCQNKKNNGWG